MTAQSLAILNTNIRQRDGLFSLNDLHRASGGKVHHRPATWLQNKQTQELINAISIDGIPSISKKQGVGTFVCKELVIAYAAWISAAFHLKVIRVFLNQQDAPKQLPLKYETAAVTLTESEANNLAVMFVFANRLIESSTWAAEVLRASGSSEASNRLRRCIGAVELALEGLTILQRRCDEHRHLNQHGYVITLI